MKKQIYTVLALALCLGAFAQEKPGVGINTKRVDKSAILDVVAEKKGVLIPRIALNDVTVFGLDGDSKKESMLVYNENGTAAKGFYYWTNNTTTPAESKWELITSESVLNQKIDEVKNYVDTEIKKITNIVDGANLSYLVAFNPTGGANGKGEFSYLVPDGNGGYTQKAITFAELIALSETKTFMKAEMHKIKDPNDETGKTEVEVVKAYYYFNEDAVNAWLIAGNDIKDINDPVKGIPFTSGFKIDVVGTVSSNLEQVFNDNRKFIDKFITKSEGNVFAEVVNNEVKLYYIDKTNGKTEVNFNTFETKTNIQKTIVDASGKEGTYTDATLGTLKEGQILFKYKSEELDANQQPVNYYLNITEEVKNSFNHQDIKDELNRYLTQGGNVYYGEITTGDGKFVLYHLIDNGDGTFTKKPIDISENIIETIKTNDKVTELINEKTKVVVTTETNVPTGEVINGYTVYKGTAEILVNHADGYDSELAANTYVVTKPMKFVVDDATKKGSWVENKADKFGRLLKASVLDKNGQVLFTTVTDVTSPGDNQFRFAFGVGNSYYPLPNDKYEVVFEYLGATKQ
ncbi:hypothetical protein [Myroides odoratimimus]|nr:hypothetical protein [Myroides odoratimimus]MDM1059641.1 hypothetical protein [Myroides odoratimimus]MDM1505682.1 hypothetical protein [Myroides odoratimimus]MDM1519475.1 hypothetical protein [Myroides odoratimimus]MDM1525474.1 hypothetical protein [Myroides odoratimimus]MDM1679031.1 hypothetical protein [Myroides odoratimimus]